MHGVIEKAKQVVFWQVDQDLTATGLEVLGGLPGMYGTTPSMQAAGLFKVSQKAHHQPSSSR